MLSQRGGSLPLARTLHAGYRDKECMAVLGESVSRTAMHSSLPDLLWHCCQSRSGKALRLGRMPTSPRALQNSTDELLSESLDPVFEMVLFAHSSKPQRVGPNLLGVQTRPGGLGPTQRTHCLRRRGISISQYFELVWEEIDSHTSVSFCDKAFRHSPKPESVALVAKQAARIQRKMFCRG